MNASRMVAPGLLCMGLLGFMVTIWMALVEAPSMGSDWNAPESYRILFIHVPFAWVSFSGFALFFGGSLAWYLKRSDTGWRLAITGAQLGLLYSLGVLISGPIWGAVEWGVPWDFQDVRLNSFAILGGISLFVALSEMNSEDTEQHRDTLSSVGIFGFGLVPLTYMATRWWQERHPGPLIGGGGEDSGVDPSILLIWMIGAVSLQILFVGQAMMTIRLLKTEEKLENLLITMEENT
ncbi:MAG TPA: cytochrome c biogenesis protein CcsA [Candidatus Thalassarchaeaceae archaeon]|nr:cytochrome c biogenesis protein CcsA [Candidatus Thalassarchaeaceae archaeon]